MRIIEFGLRPDGDEAAVRSGAVDGELGVYFSPSQVSHAEVARFLSHVLFGAAAPEISPRRAQVAAASVGEAGIAAWDRTPSPLPDCTPLEGYVTVDAPQGRYRLRRFADVNNDAHLGIAALAGAPVDASTFGNLLSGVRASVLADLYSIDFNLPLRLERLLSAEFAQHYRESLGGAGTTVGRRDVLPQPAAAPGSRSLEALIARRDELARELERGIAERRQRGEQLAQRAAELKDAYGSQADALTNFTAELERVDAELARVIARLRFAKTAETLERERFHAATEGLDTRLADLDEQIESCRRAIGSLQGREAELRHGLAAVRPAESGSQLPLADQRAHLQHVRRLLDELQGELATLARSLGSAACVCRDVHPRIEPTVLLLRQECEALDRLTAEQEQLAEYCDLQAELEHLERSRGDLHRQAEHLSQRRESLLRATRPRRQVPMSNGRPAAGVDDVPPVDKSPVAIDHLESERLTLLERRRELHERIRQADEALDALGSQRADVDRQRAELLSDDSLRETERELSVLRAKLETGDVSYSISAATAAEQEEGRRASDFLAQLSGRRYVQLKLGGTASEAIVTDRTGNTHPWDRLGAADRDLVYLSVALALIAHHAATGIRMPLIINEPTAGLDPERAATVTSVLHRFATSGHQVILFTSDRSAAERLHAAGAPLRETFSWRSQTNGFAAGPAETNGQVAVSHPATNGRVYVPAAAATSEKEGQSRAAAATESPNVFTLRLLDDIGRFPAFGSDTTHTFAAVDIYRVCDLAEADPVTLSSKLGRDSISPAVVRLWQAHVALMCDVPGVTIDDAQVLTAAGVTSPEDLAAERPKQLHDRIRDYLSGPRGKRFADSESRYTRRRVKAWIEGARQHEALWQDPAGRRQRATSKSVASDEAA